MREKYREFSDLRESGLRKDANRAAREFVAEYKENPDTSFVSQICESVDHKMNHHIWSGVVLPLYREDTRDPIAIKCLIETVQNLYSDQSAHRSLDWITEWQLVDQYLELVPDDPWATNKKKALLVGWLAYSIHEWPSGVLYGNDGATASQCQEILSAVDELRELDHDAEYADLCEDVQAKTLQYRDKLLAAETE